MSARALTRRTLVVVATIGAVVTAAPVAVAGGGLDGPPDAIDRWREAHASPAVPSFQGNPDAIDRWLEAQRNRTRTVSQAAGATRIGRSPDAIDRWLKARVGRGAVRLNGTPDAIDRWLAGRQTR